MKKTYGLGLGLVALAALLSRGAWADHDHGPVLTRSADDTGVLATLNLNGRTDTRGAFFRSLGTNGRSCASCHVAEQGFSVTPSEVRVRFARTHGRDPLFAAVDGANCPNARDGDAAARSLLLKSGLIRVGLPLPESAQFSITVVHDPYGCAIAADPHGGPPVVSVYRRPLPTTNLSFLSAIMFDGRETLAPLNSEATFAANLFANLTHQAMDATTGHAQAVHPPSAGDLADIVSFELGLYTAQLRDAQAGELYTQHAQGGPLVLARADYYPGINDSLGADPSGDAFNATAMTLFAGWANAAGPDYRGEGGRGAAARRAIAAGEVIFNTAPVRISNVRGLNDNATLGSPDSFIGHCTSCHDTPNVGNHSLPLPLDIGTAHAALPSLESDPAIAAALSELSMPDLPVYLISGCPNPFAAGEPESFYTTDPGKALLSGQCSDFNRIKGPILRGLAARAPYFHNGAAADLRELVNFYNERFGMQLDEEQKSDLIAFLNSL